MKKLALLLFSLGLITYQTFGMNHNHNNDKHEKAPRQELRKKLQIIEEKRQQLQQKNKKQHQQLMKERAGRNRNRSQKKR